MQALTRFVLRHKALVALAWLLVAVAGVDDDQRHHPPDDQRLLHAGAGLQGRQPDRRRVRQRRLAGRPMCPCSPRRPAQRVTDPAVAAQAGRVFGAIAASVPACASPITARRATRGSSPATGGRRSRSCSRPPATSFGGPTPTAGDHQGRGRGAAVRLALRADWRGPAGQRRARVEGHRDHRRDDDRVGRARW